MAGQILPLHVHDAFGWGASGGGLVFLPISVPSLLSPLIGWLHDKYNGRIVLLLSFLGAAPAFACLRFTIVNNNSSQILLCCLLFVIGLGLTSQMICLMTQVSMVLESQADSKGAEGKSGKTAQAYALFNVFYAGGIFAGALAGGGLNKAVGFENTMLMLGIFSALIALSVGVGIWRTKSI